MSATPGSNLVCPQGHGPQPQVGNFCYFCGARMMLKGVVLGTPQPATPPPSASPRAVPPGPSGNAVVMPAQQQPQAHLPPPVRSPVPQPIVCQTCGGEGAALNPALSVCPQCDWVRPLTPGYKLEPGIFLWAQDGMAMQKLRSIGPLNAAASTVSDKVGRPWIEGTFNAVRVSERQLPNVYHLAVLAARILNVSHMPDVYVSGERMWEAATYGSDRSAFIVLGSALVTSFPGDDLLFLLAREMGHCRAGHALWKTVIRFLVGEQRQGGLMGHGLLSMLDITRLVEGAVELPLLAWARQSEITADRAGLLAVRDESIARRVLLTWCLKSMMLFKQVNVAEWMKQQEDVEDQASRLSEVAMSPTPYITRRLRLLAQFARGPEVDAWRTHVGPLIDAVRTTIQSVSTPASQTRPGASSPPISQPHQDQTSPPAKDDAVRLQCGACGTVSRVPRSVLEGKAVLKVRCANPECKNVLTLKKAPPKTPTPPNDDLRLKCVGCGTRLRVPSSAMAGKDQLNVRCPNAQCGKTMTLKKKPAPAPIPADQKPANLLRKAKRARKS